MSKSYEDYDIEYNSNLSRVRSFLAGTRSRSTLTECERLLGCAQNCAQNMLSISETEENTLRIQEAKMRMDRDLSPLSKEVTRALNEMSREELFYSVPGPAGAGSPSNDMQSLIQNSDDMLRGSLALCSDSERIGNSTLEQMERQREQLQTTSGHIDATRNAATQAGMILRSMSQRAFHNKMVLKTIIAFLILVNLYLVYRKIKHVFF